MSYVRINITDKNKVLVGEIHGSMCEALVAALTAEPETVGELEEALERFINFESDWSYFGRMKNYEFEEPLRFGSYLNLERYDAGILVIDLAVKIVAIDSTYDSYAKEGTIAVRDELEDEKEGEFMLPYRLSDDWRFVYSMPEYEGIAKSRREDLLKAEPLDARDVLFGKGVFEFLVEEMQAADDLDDEEIFADIHRKWLMTERGGLRGKTPREILFEKREFVNFELHSRSLQWSITKKCPPDLSPDSNAYKFAGFGTHEWVVYYDLIRFLLEMYSLRLKEDKILDFESEVKYLSGFAEKWLNTKNPEFSGRKPSDIIESERRRRNLTMTAHECLIDEDCPMCVEMSEMFDTPMFWYLDGCNMEDEFAFSPYRTLQEWEDEQKRFAEFNREFDAKMERNGEDISILDEEIIS